MKICKRSKISCIGIGVIVAAIFFVAPASSPAGAIELGYANFFPPTHVQAKLGVNINERLWQQIQNPGS